MLMRYAALLVVVACKGSTAACEEAVDEGLARHRAELHVQHEADARANPQRRLELLDVQYDEDRTLERRRDVTVDHCVADKWTEEERACVTRGDIVACLRDDQQRALAGARPTLSSDQWIATFQNFTNRMCHCRDRACADRTNDAQRRFADTINHTAGSSDDERFEVDLVHRYSDCLARAMSVEVVPPPVAVAGMPPPRCVRYLAAIDTMGRCDKLAAARDAMRQAADAMRDNFSQMQNMPPEAWKAADDACGQALVAFVQAMQSAGCELPAEATD
jgi:hypothetical protein